MSVQVETRISQLEAIAQTALAAIQRLSDGLAELRTMIRDERAVAEQPGSPPAPAPSPRPRAPGGPPDIPAGGPLQRAVRLASAPPPSNNRPPSPNGAPSPRFSPSSSGASPPAPAPPPASRRDAVFFHPGDPPPPSRSVSVNNDPTPAASPRGSPAAPTATASLSAPARLAPAPPRRANSAPDPGHVHQFTSQILTEIPGVLSNFSGKRFVLLWRGSETQFASASFHAQCDGRANTLTLVKDTTGCIFGGFSPVAWESREWNGQGGMSINNCFLRDPSGTSFLFTVTNSSDVPSQKFELRAGKPAINCEKLLGPSFGGPDLIIRDKSNQSATSESSLGTSYKNEDQPSTLFTGSSNFTVAEIEVFEVV